MRPYVQVQAPQVSETGPLVGPTGVRLPRLVPRPGSEYLQPMAENLNKWLQGDLSFLDGRMTTTGMPVKDKAKRKRDAMADVLDGKK